MNIKAMKTGPMFCAILCYLVLCKCDPEVPEPLRLKSTSSGWSATFGGAQGSLTINLGNGAALQTKQCSRPGPAKDCFHIPNTEIQLSIQNVDTGFSTVTCDEVRWENPDSQQEDCILLGNSFWYGGTELRFQRWPIQNLDLERVPYVTGDFAHYPIGGIMDNLWLSSHGHLIFVDRETPLFVKFNHSESEQFCLSASYDQYPYSGASATRKSHKELKYTVCTSDNVREAFQFAASRWLPKPSGVVDESLLTRPIWSTWARYLAQINETIVLSYAQEIVANGFKGSHFEIDDKWESCYGETDFDPTKFPTMAATVANIKNMGFSVSLWIHPYLNTNCPSYFNPRTREFLIKNGTTGDPLVCDWWNGQGGYLDSTSPGATDYLVSKVENIQKSYGIDSFKFDSGEISYISQGFKFSDSDVMATPNVFTRLYVETAARLGNGVEVRVAYNTQHLPIFTRMLDKDSRWDFNNGLKTLIPTALHMSVIGYPFILPDMIGGNNYGSKELPEKELYIRWLQVNALMPALQFSIAPWQYDQEVVNISKAMVALHEQYAPLIYQLAQEAVQTGNPIVRPLWWVAPKDVEAQSAEQQFLLGNNIMVAPVVDKGATVRDVYFPEGEWKDQIVPNTTYIGPGWIRNYQAELHQLPFFLRI